MKVVLLHDAHAGEGRADEQDAMVQVEALGAALRASGHRTSAVPFGLDLSEVRARLSDESPDLVVNLVESVGGRGCLIHLAPALLDTLGLPYTGAGTAAMFLTSHKVWAKRVLAGHGIPTPAWVEQDGRIGGAPPLPGRFIVKSVWEDASVGLDDDSVVDVASAGELVDLVLERRDGLGGEAFAEAWVEGREFNLSLIEDGAGVRVLPVAEMCFVDYPADKPRLVGYRAKWIEDSFEYGSTVRRFDLPPEDAALIARMQDLARQCWNVLDLAGYARVDFRVASDGTPFVLEINANPCLSPDAGFMAAADRAGMDSSAVVERVLDAAMRRGRAVVSLPAGRR